MLPLPECSRFLSLFIAGVVGLLLAGGVQ